MDVGRCQLLGWIRLRLYHISSIRAELGENEIKLVVVVKFYLVIIFPIMIRAVQKIA